MAGSTQTRTGARPRVTADVVLPVSARTATDRLAAVFRAAGHSSELLMVVGPGRRTHLLGKQVRASLTHESRRGSTEVFHLHWDPVGPTAAAYPRLDANVGVTPVDVNASLLSIVATYHPPLGALGAGVDRAAMSRVADATVASALHQLADAITHPSRRVVRSVTS
jgi:hypothetical protein